MTEPAFIIADVETTGLKPSTTCHLLEVALVVVDSNLDIIAGSSYSQNVRLMPESVDRLIATAPDRVKQMHTDSELWVAMRKEVREQPFTWYDFDDDLLPHIQKFFPEPRTARLLGNSLRLDLNFLEYFCPKTYAHLDYHSTDISGTEDFLVRIGGYPPYVRGSSPKHRAMDDVLACLEQARHWRDQVKF